MITIRPATNAELRIVRQIAYATWPSTYGEILSMAQIEYMLELMYNLDTLQKQLEEKSQVFLLAFSSNEILGFASYELNYKDAASTKIHKIYMLPQAQGKGIGKALIEAIETTARQNGNDALILNVNQFNKAVSFYERIGFKKAGNEVIDIGNGYVMDDFIMQKTF
ncbi:MAG: GNAT family N-acetyltransferase [Cytophagia bacterium]|nr:MAG: GNAT family N-acetyltransferase [Cytophagales bacterium]TAG40898.1 MAG: GNAT family N-acetyltransferase [Cytophagia bacterium]TAG82567.1 MAG: GNAT family N-acetyltransferase [Cytophagales bacterium]